jgi:hypothetical protein
MCELSQAADVVNETIGVFHSYKGAHMCDLGAFQTWLAAPRVAACLEGLCST